MTTQTKYVQGQFSWADLGTTDAAAAKKFYGPLFGWTFDDTPAGPGMTYSMVKLDGRSVCALYTMGKEMQGIPPHWLSYVTVDDVDAMAKKVTANGGKLMKEPFDVMEHGRMAVLTDPTGAALALWQAKSNTGAEVRGVPGALTWHELYTTNVDQAGKFYVQTFGWKTKSYDMGPAGTYTLLSVAGSDKGIGGMMPMPANMKGVPSNWVAYFDVADCAASTKKATELGGKVLAPPTEIPNIGTFSIIQDPQGAVFALYKNAH